MDNMKYLELLGLTKDALKNKIPVKVDANSIKNCDEANSLRKDLDGLDELREKIMEVINKIFANLNDDNVVPQFIKVLQKKTTEKAILEENKEKYKSFFSELEVLTSDIKVMKLSIQAKNEVFIRVKNNTFKPNEDNEKFFKDLENHVQTYNQRLVNLNQGMNFYNEFQNRLNDINTHVTDYLLARDIEKNELIKTITGGNQQVRTQPQNTNQSIYLY